jgi:hypothetical protein
MRTNKSKGEFLLQESIPLPQPGDLHHLCSGSLKGLNFFRVVFGKNLYVPA